LRSSTTSHSFEWQAKIKRNLKNIAMASPQAWSTALLISVTVSSISLTGCTQLTRFGIGVTPIRQVVANPSQYTNVTVRGKVTQEFSLLGKGAYQLEDSEGASLWVITTIGTPPLDSRVTVRGRAAEGFSFGGQNFAVTIDEAERF
jgi:hypothetical protein